MSIVVGGVGLVVVVVVEVFQAENRRTALLTRWRAAYNLRVGGANNREHVECRAESIGEN